MSAQPVNQCTFDQRHVIAERQSAGPPKVGFDAFAALPEGENFDRFAEQAPRNPPFPGAADTRRYRQICFGKLFGVPPNHDTFLM